MNSYKKSNWEKFGKHFRPIFWAYSSVFFFFVLIRSFEILFLPQWRQGIGIPFLIFCIIASSAMLTLATYKITHPYISKDGHDEQDEKWALAAFILIPLTVHLLVLGFWDINLVELASNLFNIIL